MPAPLSVPRSSAVALALIAALGCRAAHPPASSDTAAHPPPHGSEQAPAPIRLTVVGTNDLHGWVTPHRATLSDGTAVEQGGLANFAGYLAILREDNPGGVLLLDAGDLFQGTLAANLTEGAVVIDAYNRLGYHAAAIGNHEFDYGPAGPVSVATAPGADPFGALKARLAQARFPLLAANIYQADGARPAWLPDDGTALLELKGVKVGILGLVTPTTPSVTNPVNVSSLRFGRLVPDAVSAAARLRQRGAEVVIAVVHAGGRCTRLDDPNDLSSCDTQTGEIFELLHGVPDGTLDAVVAGHTHAAVGHFVRGTPVIENWGLGRYFGAVELWVDPRTRKVIPDRTRIQAAIPICEQMDESGSCDPKQLQGRRVKLGAATFLGRTVRPDAEIARVLEPALARVSFEQNRSLGLQVPQRLGRDYESESALGSFLADSLREMERADVALLNSGGLRADLDAGEVTYGDLFEVIPFDNTVATVVLTGEELIRLLQAAYGARKGVFQISGLKVTLGRCPGRDRFRKALLSSGKALASRARYRVVMPDFLARGGDGLGSVLASVPPDRVDLGTHRELNFRDALVAFWKSKGRPLVGPPPGRIVFVDGSGPCPDKPGSQTGIP